MGFAKKTTVARAPQKRHYCGVMIVDGGLAYVSHSIQFGEDVYDEPMSKKIIPTFSFFDFLKHGITSCILLDMSCSK